MLRLRHVIDLFKGLTLPLCIFLCWRYKRLEDITCCLYTALHGGYGVLWVTKSWYFPDKAWEVPCDTKGLLGASFLLILYWAAPFLLMRDGAAHSPAFLASTVLLYTIGCFLHFCSDMQKHATLKVKAGLISDGLWSYSRNPNYLGEFFIYTAFALLAWHWLPVIFLALNVAVVWIPNMLKKDKRLIRHQDFDAYRQRTGIFFPLSRCDLWRMT
jgi:protein-S-isoprenylcysteine O-methyltransferase Ste14